MSIKVTSKGKLDLLKFIDVVDPHLTSEGNAEGTLFYSGMRISILETHKSYVKLQVSFEHKGKPFWVMESVELTKGDNHIICCDENFKIQNKLVIS
jgi:hypothetical protein